MLGTIFTVCIAFGIVALGLAVLIAACRPLLPTAEDIARRSDAIRNVQAAHRRDELTRDMAVAHLVVCFGLSEAEARRLVPDMDFSLEA